MLSYAQQTTKGHMGPLGWNWLWHPPFLPAPWTPVSCRSRHTYSPVSSSPHLQRHAEENRVNRVKAAGWGLLRADSHVPSC